MTRNCDVACGISPTTDAGTADQIRQSLKYRLRFGFEKLNRFGMRYEIDSEDPRYGHWRRIKKRRNMEPNKVAILHKDMALVHSYLICFMLIFPLSLMKHFSLTRVVRMYQQRQSPTKFVMIAQPVTFVPRIREPFTINHFHLLHDTKEANTANFNAFFVGNCRINNRKLDFDDKLAKFLTPHHASLILGGASNLLQELTGQSSVPPKMDFTEPPPPPKTKKRRRGRARPSDHSAW